MIVKAVLFDLDNTLIDFTKFKQKAVQAAARAMVKAGLQADSKKLAEELLEYYYGYGIESDDAFESFLMKKFGVVDFRVLAAAVNAYLHEKYIHLKPFPRVVETLRILRRRGLKLAVVSDGVRLKAWMRLNAAGLDGFFDVVVAFEDTGRKKPAREPFLKACKALKVKPSECLFVGDWPERDIAGAKKLGMKTCLAAYGQLKEGFTPADCEIRSVEELLRFI